MMTETSNDRSTEHEPQGLGALDIRVLGSLIEKAFTTPDVYPLTVNNVLMACNQKTAREPVMHLEQGAVHHALRQLEVQGWVRSQHTARAERYAHRVDGRLSLTSSQLALIGLLMLRGPQTAHELLGRSERMAKFDGVDGVVHTLQRLSEREQPLVQMLPRRPGQSSDRYMHLLGGALDLDALDDGWVDTTPSPGGGPSLRERLDALEARVAELERLLQAGGASTSEESADPDASEPPTV